MDIADRRLIIETLKEKAVNQRQQAARDRQDAKDYCYIDMHHMADTFSRYAEQRDNEADALERLSQALEGILSNL